MPVSPARQVAFTVLRRVFEQDAYADRALRGEADRAHLDPRERAFATQLAFGAVQRMRTLDHVTDRFVKSTPDPAARAALRLGAQQILFLDVPDHAAVDASVELTKALAPRSAGFVNAVLRRVTRDGAGILATLRDDTAERAAVKHSVPDWIARLWFDELGADEARLLLATGNEPAEHALRVNALVATGAETIVVDGAFDAHGSKPFADGTILPQSRASQLVAHAVDPRSGERILDLCAAPGGKTTHLAALMGDEGEVVAYERHPGRAQALRETAWRMRASCVTVVDADGRAATGSFDRALVDPPCSGLGTLRSRPDLRWRARPGPTELQRELLETAKRLVRPGGRVVYSTCTLARAENEDIAGPAQTTTFPHRDGTDGFFIASLTL